jgi:hypothetical protein
MCRLARAFFETQVNGRVGEERFHKLLEEMSAKHYTATFEYLDVTHQHVELFTFPRSTFRFIAFTSTQDVSLLCCDIEAGVAMAAEAGFETMKITAHDAKDQDALFQSIRQTHGTEGSVVYYLNADNKVPTQRVHSPVRVCCGEGLMRGRDDLHSSAGTR